MKKLAVTLSLCFTALYAEEVPVFSPVLDIPMLTTSIGVGVYGSLKLRQTDVPDHVKDKSDLLPWDRPFAGSYSLPADIASNFTNNVMVAPLIIAGVGYYYNDINGMQAWGLVSMYVEAMALQSGVNLLVRSSQLWPRPYVYESDFDPEESNGEAFGSFYSGHASAAFSAAVFTTYAFEKLYPNSEYFWPVCLGSFSLATATGVLRVAAGKHYPTDVVAGALIGSGITLSVIGVHELWAKRVQVAAVPGYVGFNVTF